MTYGVPGDLSSQREDMPVAKIVVGVDGSANSARAVRWCAEHAAALNAEVVAVHVIDLGAGVGVPIPPMPPEQRRELLHRVTHDWCKPLADAGVAFRGVLMDGRPALALRAAAGTEQAELVVTGRRGRGGFAKLLLGSTSHQLTHHLERPLVIVP